MQQDKHELGQRGEQAAADHLRQHGYTIVVTNWRCPLGELDIVARQGDTWVFAEVKTRRAGAEAAFANITGRKRDKLIRLAYAYLAAHRLEDADWRIDVLAVSIGRGSTLSIDHVENALDW